MSVRLSVAKENEMRDLVSFDVTLAHKIKRALIRNNIPDAADLDWLAAGDNIAVVRKLRLGHTKVVDNEHVIDLDADPHVPEGWVVNTHRGGGLFRWDVKNLQLYLDPEQKNYRGIDGQDLFAKLVEKPILNANVLDYLLSHPYLIPEEWKSFSIYFWGTVYTDQSWKPCVRSLLWMGDRWGWSCYALNEIWRNVAYAALDTRSVDLI